jgi:histone-lysine N-methyltransferase EZH2
MVTDSHVMIGEDNMRKEEFVDENICKQELTDNKSWKALEKGLLEKGMEIFGKNRSDMFELEMCFSVFIDLII